VFGLPAAGAVLTLSRSDVPLFPCLGLIDQSATAADGPYNEGEDIRRAAVCFSLLAAANMHVLKEWRSDLDERITPDGEER
jgi:hypothetical protein